VKNTPLEFYDIIRRLWC